MSLQQELGLKKPIALQGHEALLNIYYTASQLHKKAGDFLQPFGITDVQFNLMMLLRHQSCEDGLNQAHLSKMMLVNRADITSLIDRMEKTGFVVRASASTDRRYNIIKLTSRGEKLLDKIEPLYTREIQKIMNPLKNAQQKSMIAMLEKVRNKVT
jgi:DNA-binding MarR family transcriptional regulator